jgi:hypothetical protein
MMYDASLEARCKELPEAIENKAGINSFKNVQNTSF